MIFTRSHTNHNLGWYSPRDYVVTTPAWVEITRVSIPGVWVIVAENFKVINADKCSPSLAVGTWTSFCSVLMVDRQSRISRTPYPPIGGSPRCHRGPKIQSRHHFATQRKLRSPKLKYEALEFSNIRGPFERKVLMHYSYFGPLWKQGTHCNCCWGPFERKVAH